MLISPCALGAVIFTGYIADWLTLHQAGVTSRWSPAGRCLFAMSAAAPAWRKQA